MILISRLGRIACLLGLIVVGIPLSTCGASFHLRSTTRNQSSSTETEDVAQDKVRDTVRSVWNAMVRRNNKPEDPDILIIRRPFSEIPGDAVSEGFGYGLIISYYQNQQRTFNRLIRGAEKYMWNPDGWYDWRIGPDNQKIGTGAATDAEQDIAFMFILAANRVHRGVWSDYNDGFYAKRAQTMLNSMWDHHMVVPDSYVVAPGYGWGGNGFVNPGYFSPAWYRVFSRFDKTHGHDWERVIDVNYQMLKKSPGYDKGLMPDWMSPEGCFVDWQLGYNTYGGGRYMYKDAIRTLWRIGTDYMWNPKDTHAREYIRNADRFIQGNISNANFFDMNGNLLAADDLWYFDNGKRVQPRRLHNVLTVSMWLVPIYLIHPEKKLDLLNALLVYNQARGEYWGVDPGNKTDASLFTLDHEELYFEQFLGHFGAMFLIGEFVNDSDLK